MPESPFGSLLPWMRENNKRAPGGRGNRLFDYWISRLFATTLPLRKPHWPRQTDPDSIWRLDIVAVIPGEPARAGCLNQWLSATQHKRQLGKKPSVISYFSL